MADTTRPVQARTGPKVSGLCRGDGVVEGHTFCFPGPVMVGTTVAIPRWCFCPCHDKAGAR